MPDREFRDVLAVLSGLVEPPEPPKQIPERRQDPQGIILRYFEAEDSRGFLRQTAIQK